MTKVAAANIAVENARELFGEHPEEVIGVINSAAEALGWLQEIFITIKNEELDGRNAGRIKRLAELGAYIALDIENYAGCQYETYLERLRTAAVIDSTGATT